MPERLIWLRVLHIGGLSEIVYYNVLACNKFSVLVWCVGIRHCSICNWFLLQLTAARPPRPETKSSYSRSRPSSGNIKHHKLQSQLSLPNFLNGSSNNQLPTQSHAAANGSSISVSGAPTAVANNIALTANHSNHNSSVSYNITSNVYVESPLARLPENPPRKILRSQSVKGPEASAPVLGAETSKLSRPASQSSVTNGCKDSDQG